MAHLQGKEKSAYVQEMFGRVAKRYDLMNKLMTGGQDRVSRRFAVKQAQIGDGAAVLDLATGTGDIAFEILQSVPTATVVGGDFALPMMEVGRDRSLLGKNVGWCGADALNLPFREQTFDAVLSAYLIRNVPDIPRTLQEQVRVLKPGGRIVILDTAPPPDNILKPFILIHLKYVIPTLGRIVAGKEVADAYKYLPESTQGFKRPEELVAMMQRAGIQNVGFQKFLFGMVVVYWGNK